MADALYEGIESERSKENAESRSAKYKPNYPHITVFMVIMTLSGFTQSYSFQCTNQLAETFNVKYEWNTRAQQDLY